MPRDNPSWTSYFDRFWIDFGSQLVTPEPTKSLKFYWFYKHFLLCGLFKIKSNFDPMLVPTCLRFPCQHPPNSLQKSILKGIVLNSSLASIFKSILARFWNLSCAHVGHVFVPKTVLPAGAPPFGSILAPC